MVDECGVQENIVCYDDEGGGEEDTAAFSVSALTRGGRATAVSERRRDPLSSLNSPDSSDSREAQPSYHVLGEGGAAFQEGRGGGAGALRSTRSCWI